MLERRFYNSRLRRKAIPDELFKYRSKTAALALLGKAQNQTYFHGLNLAVCLFAPPLCLLSRALRSAAMPM